MHPALICSTIVYSTFVCCFRPTSRHTTTSPQFHFLVPTSNSTVTCTKEAEFNGAFDKRIIKWACRETARHFDDHRISLLDVATVWIGLSLSLCLSFYKFSDLHGSLRPTQVCCISPAPGEDDPHIYLSTFIDRRGGEGVRGGAPYSFTQFTGALLLVPMGSCFSFHSTLPISSRTLWAPKRWRSPTRSCWVGRDDYGFLSINLQMTES